MNLAKIGWNSDLENHFTPLAEKGYSAGRVTSEHTHIYTVVTENGELKATVSGRIRGKLKAG